MKIPVFEPYLGKEEEDAVVDCIRRNWITGGPKVEEFEKRIAELQGSKYAVACCNGTMALYMALVAAGLKKGDRVAVPSFTFVASANAVVLAGGEPVFVDVRRDTMNIDVNSVPWGEIDSVMPVHIYGQVADMSEVMAYASEYGVYVVEDAAQAVGASFKGKGAGTWGNAGTLSFYADKTVSSGEGGMVLTDDEKIYKKLKSLKHQGRQGRGWYFHEEIGYNFRLTDLQAAVGLAQLDKLDYIVKRKRENEQWYKDELSDCKTSQFVEFPYIDGRGVRVPFRVNILVNEPEKLGQYLDQHGIQTRRFFFPLNLQQCYHGHMENTPNADWLYAHGLSLPSSVSLQRDQIEFICERIRECVSVS